MQESDWDRVAEIYRQGIESNCSTFETKCPEYAAWNAAHLEICRLVCEDDGTVSGWAALSPTSGRAVYRGVAEVSIYVAEKAKHSGVGTALLTRMIRESERAGIWTLQSGIFAVNHASLALHRKCGFRMVGVREKIARNRFGMWQDTVLMERRSAAECFSARMQKESRPGSAVSPAGLRAD